MLLSKTPHDPNPRAADRGIPLANKSMRSIFLMEEPSCFGEEGKGMFSLLLQTCKLAQDFRCDFPRTRVRGAGGVIFHSRTAGDRHD